jgi:CheY-like chemotaxis protein
MPVLDGRSATRQIRQGDGASARSRIVALTANALPTERDDFIAQGMDDVLTKPLKKADLRKVLGGQITHVTVAASELIDHAHRAETAEVMGAQSYAKIVHRFVAEVDTLVTGLGAVELPKHDHIAAEAHEYAGNASLFGATALRTALLEIEYAAKEREGSALAIRVSALPPLWQQTRAALLKTVLTEVE